MSTPVLFSPRIACRSERNGKYLRCVYDDHEKGIRIDASADRVVGHARTRFYLEKYDEASRFVHIRCSYNNKYWVPQKVTDDAGRIYWVIGTAHEPDQHLFSPSCTLFEYIQVSATPNSFWFHHPGYQMNVCIADETKPYLQLKDKGSDTFVVIGLSQQMELPKHIAVKGDNGLYLHPKIYYKAGYYDGLNPNPISTTTYPLPGNPDRLSSATYLQFGGKDKGHPDVLHTTSTNDEGLVQIKTNGMIWRFQVDDFVRLDSIQHSDDPYTFFKVVSAGDGFTALRNVASNLFCNRTSSYGQDSFFLGTKKEDCLSAKVNWIGPAEKLKVEEPVRDREITDVNFHIAEARIHDMGSIPGDEQPHLNTHDIAEPVEISFQRKMSKESKCVSSISQKRIEEVKSSIDVDLDLPLPKEAHLNIHGEHSKYEHNELTTEKNLEEHKSSSHEVNQKHIIYVPPKTLSTVKFVTRQVQYDIPFSYTEKVVMLMNGEQLEPVFHDDGLNTVILRYTSFIVESKPLK